MPYIGHSPTNAGSFVELDDISSGFNGSTAGFTMQVGAVSVTPSIENLLICLDGVVQQPTSAFSISGSTITFTENVPSGTDFYGILMGQSATVGQGTITASEMAVTGNGTDGQLLKTDGDGTFTWIDQNTVTAPASGLQGNTLASGVTASSLTSVGTLTTLTVDDMTFNGSTISDAGAFDIDAGGVIKLDAGGGQIQFFDDGTEIGVLENSSSDFVIESKVQDKDILFKGNDGGSGIELMRMNMSGANVGISTGNSIGAKLHVADNRSTAYDGTAEPAETMIIHNKNGSDGSGVNNYASLSWQVADGATSQGFLNFKRTGDNTGYFTFTSRTGSSEYKELLWINGATSNWAMNLTGNSPYGMQIITTSDGSSSHDAFVIKRDGNNKVFEIFNNGDLTTYGGGTATFAGNITQSASSNLRHTMTAGGSGEASLVLTANNSTGDSFVRWETNSTTFCLGLDNSDGDKFILSAGSDPHSNSVINIQPDGSSIAVDKQTSFGDRIDFTGKPNIGNRVHSVAISSGSSSQYNMNGAGGNCSGGFIVGACHRDSSTTADNSVCIYAHVHTQGANVYSAIIERNDDSDVTISHNGSGMLTCTNNGNSTVNFVVKYLLLTAFDTSNNLK